MPIFARFICTKNKKMTKIKSLVWSVLVVVSAASASSAVAQDSNPSNLTSSPYTRYGFGKLGSVGNASTRAMGDVGIALRTNMYTNLYNPASLTAIDTLTMLFDTALDAEWFTMSENGVRENDWNAGFSYLSFHFPLWNRFAGAIAYNPYSMVGYEYGNEVSMPIENALVNNDTLDYSNSYSGSGGLQHFQLSLAWNPVKTRTMQLNLGATAGYICGAVDHGSSIYVSSGQSNSTYSTRSYSCIGWDLLFGAQYTQQIVPGQHVTLGATFAPRTHIGCETQVVKYCGTTDSIGESITNSASLSAPMKFGAGLSYQIDRKLTATAEYSFENWAKVAGLDANMKRAEGLYQDIHRVAAGFEYRPKLYAQSYFQTCIYRVGASVKNTYVKTFGNQSEFTASCGIGMPCGRRSMFNFSAAYTHSQSVKNGALKENFLHLTLGITFNEMMFYRSRLQ
jgi:hypothetical protein